MTLNLDDPQTEKLAADVARLPGETELVAVRTALRERRERLLRQAKTPQQRNDRLTRFLEAEIWPLIPDDVRGKTITKAEREEILGYGPDGY